MEFSVIVHLSFSRFPQFRYICGLNTDDMKFTQYLLLAAKGCAMGMADVVPGVSGGTIAFISGIYEELIESIKERERHRPAAARHVASEGVLAPRQRPFPVARADRDRDRHLLAGAADDLPAHAPPDCHLVVLLRADRRLGVARGQADRALERPDCRRMSGRARPPHGGSPSPRRPRPRHVVVHHAVGRHRHLRHDPARHFGRLHPAPAG